MKLFLDCGNRVEELLNEFFVSRNVIDLWRAIRAENDIDFKTTI